MLGRLLSRLLLDGDCGLLLLLGSFVDGGVSRDSGSGVGGSGDDHDVSLVMVVLVVGRSQGASSADGGGEKHGRSHDE